MQNLKLSLISYIHTPDILSHLLIINLFLWSLYYIYPIMDNIMLLIKTKIKNAKVLMNKYKTARFIFAIIQMLSIVSIYYWISQYSFIEKLKLQNNTNVALILIILQLSRFIPMLINGILLGKEIEPFIVWQYIIRMFIISYVSTISLPILLSNFNLVLLVPIIESINILVGKDKKKIENNGLFPKYSFINYFITIVEFSNISSDLLNTYDIVKIVNYGTLIPIFILNVILLTLILFYNVWGNMEYFIAWITNFYINNEEEQEHMQNESVGDGYNYEKITKFNNKLNEFEFDKNKIINY